MPGSIWHYVGFRSSPDQPYKFGKGDMPIHQEEIHLTDLDMASFLEMRGTMRPVLSSIRTTLLCFTDTNDNVLEGAWA
jgi:hypothetical protein